MGVIKDGTVSGSLPIMKTFAVHYPGYPLSTSRAIETLGGTEAILEVHSSHSNKLVLHFRPEEPHSHPAFGTLRPCNNFLLKVARKKIDVNNTGGNDTLKQQFANQTHLKQTTRELPDRKVSQRECELGDTRNVEHSPERVQGETCADIVAHVSEAYYFTGMVDYQHVLPVHADVSRRKRSRIETGTHTGKGDLADLYHDDLMILLPPLFSLKDAPENLVLRTSNTMSSKKKQEGVGQQWWEMYMEPCLAIDFNIPDILLVPQKVQWQDYISQGSPDWDLQMAVSNLFDERPIWQKGSLIERLLDQGVKVAQMKLKRLLLACAYYFSNGPFLRFWIRKGYDPRKDNESCIYQRIDFRVPPSLRNFCDANAANGVKQRWMDMCEFRAFPYKCQTSFQLIDLNDDYIQQEIRKPLTKTTCSCATGWFTHQTLHRLRLRVAVRFLSIYPKGGVDDLLKSASDRFEKSKRIDFFKVGSRLDEDGHNVNRGNKDEEETDEGENVGNEDIDETDEVIYEEEEENQLDDSEDDLDEPHTVLQDDGILLPPKASQDVDNISKNYLQELFGTFPSNEASVSNMQNADTSDGEYHIYGQYSDDEDFDEDH